MLVRMRWINHEEKRESSSSDLVRDIVPSLSLTHFRFEKLREAH